MRIVHFESMLHLQISSTGGSIRHPPISQSQAVQRRLEPRPSSLQLAGTPPSLWNSATSGVGAEGAALPGGDGGSDEGWEMMAI